MKNKTVLFTTIVAFFAAIICISCVIKIPLGPVPLVFQNAMCVLSGVLIGGIYSAIPTLLFLVIGVIGFPVFSGGTSGFAIILGPTGGFLLGYLLGAFVSGMIASRVRGREKQSGKNSKKSDVWQKVRLSIATILGIFVIYIPGIFHFMMWAGNGLNKNALISALAICFFPYILGDIIKSVIVILVAIKIRPVVAQYLE